MFPEGMRLIPVLVSQEKVRCEGNIAEVKSHPNSTEN